MSQPTTAPAQTTGQSAQPTQAQSTQPQGKAATQAQPTASEMRKLKLKLDGQDVELPESEVIALAQRGKVSDQRFMEAANLKREADAIMKFAKENPREFFAKTGMNAREWAENYLIEELKREQMTPEQRRAAENEAKLKQYEDEKKADTERKRQEEMDRLKEQHLQNYEKLFIDALNKSGLPKTKYTIKRMAELQLVNVKKKLELSPDQLAKVVREDYVTEQKELFGAVDGDQLLEILGPDLIKKLSKAQIAKLKAKGIQKSQGGTPPSNKKDPQMSWREYQRKNRRLP